MSARGGTADEISFILLCGLTGLLCLAALCCCIYMCCLRCIKVREGRQRMEIILRRCKRVKYKKNLEMTSTKTTNYTCVICLEDFTVGCWICVCPCDHSFHENCLYKWIRTATVCPVCKQSVTQSHHTPVEETTPLL